MPNSSRWISGYTSLAVFLLTALSLVVSSGYSLGAAMLLLGGLMAPFFRQQVALTRRDKAVLGVMAGYTLVVVLMLWAAGESPRTFDRPSRLLLAVPALLLVIAYPPKLSALWSGCALGAIGAGSWALWQKVVMDTWRAGGYTHVIQFGNLSMLLGILCLAGMGWAVMQPYRRAWLGLLASGALMGMLGSLMSGSRGGWIGLPLIILVLYRSYGAQLPGRWKVSLALVALGIAALVFFIPQTGVQERALQAVGDITNYISGHTQDTSLGARFEMWKGAAHLIADKPLLGWGETGYRQGMAQLVEQGIINPVVLEFGHAHNEFIDAFAKRGLVGLTALLLLYVVPMKLFGQYLRHSNLEVRATALAGVILSLAYMDFGLSQTFLAHNSGVMMFAYLLAVLWGVHSHQRNTLE